MNKKIIIYDGVCGFCDRWVQFILQNKPDKSIRFVSFQSERAKSFLDQYHITDISTIVFIDKNRCYSKSKAILRIFKHLDSNWKYLSYLSWIPPVMSDYIYTLIANNRYKILGKNKSCRIPTKEDSVFFLK